MGYNTINEDAVDAETEALIVRLIAMELDEIPTSLSGSSTETLVEVNDRMKQQAANITAHQKLIEKEVTTRNSQKKEENKMKEHTLVFSITGTGFTMSLQVSFGSTLSEVYKAIIKVINRKLAKFNLKLTNSMFKKLNLSFGGNTIVRHPRTLFGSVVKHNDMSHVFNVSFSDGNTSQLNNIYEKHFAAEEIVVDDAAVDGDDDEASDGENDSIISNEPTDEK